MNISINDRDEHYCKWCRRSFFIKIDPEEDRFVFLKCPTCGWDHPRQFKDGVAIHCEIGRRTNEPVTLTAGTEGVK